MSLSSNLWVQAQALAAQAVLATGDDQEMFYRCAISRAYYAAFHHARNIAIADGAYTGNLNPRRHDHLVTVLIGYNSRISDDMDRFKEIRHMADYDEVVSGLAAKWNVCQQIAQRCLQHIQPKT